MGVIRDEKAVCDTSAGYELQAAQSAVPIGYKQTEVGVIPEDWYVLTLGDVATVRDGTHQTPRYVRFGIPFYSVEHVTSGDFSNTKFISEEEHKYLTRSFKIEKGDVLMTRIGSIGDCVLVDWDAEASFYVSLALLKIHGACPAYVAAYSDLPAFKKEADLHSLPSATPKKINLGPISQIRVALPSTREEQRAIATALNDVDTLLVSLDRLIAKKRDLKQAAMQQLLTGQTRLPGFAGQWKVKRLGDIAKIQRGASPRPIDSPVWFDQNSKVGWVRISDVTSSGLFLYETSQRLSPLGVAHSRPVAAGSLIMSICATVGRPIITKIDVCIHDGFVVFEDLEADQVFVFYVLKWIEPNWVRHGQTGSQMNLNTGLIKGTEIDLPPLKEQAAIATVLTDMDAELEAVEQRRTKTAALKQAMMQELLTGRTRLVESTAKECTNG